ncbi:MAG TPA: ribose-5-phosphate isomerase RpiA [Polyangiaceae bacterium]|nr:ribose-5-phosphate isomerase RpiA [Polyangiaceae bacterium]
MDKDRVKRLAAEAALAKLPPEGLIGLGTGTTARHFILAVAELVRAGKKYVGVATSEQSRSIAVAAGLPLRDDAGPWDVAVCVDGADEVSAELDIIKGGGGAHTREKIVNFAARLNVIVVDESKLSQKLGERWAVPVEVLPFGHCETAKLMQAYGKPALRLRDGAPFRTDSGNYVYDVATGPIDEPQALHLALKTIPGVVETGLFCGRADVVLVARESGIEELSRKAR